ncbi:MAG: S26 family signal peptidase, partial [Acidimicrobiales bacterium]
AVLAGGAALGACAAARLVLAGRVQVHGDSMLPTLLPGDRLLTLRLPWLRRGDVVVVTDPRLPSRALVKRVVAVSRAAVEVEGDNAASSTDSRVLGPLPRSHVRARAIWRYWPPGHAGWLPRLAPRQGSGASCDATAGVYHVAVARPEDQPEPPAGRGTAAAPSRSPSELLAELLDPAALDGLQAADLRDIRARRAECSALEVQLSYLRRLAQGRLDIIHAEIARREPGGDTSYADLVERLPEILGRQVSAPGLGRLPAVLAPDLEDSALTAELDAVADPSVLAGAGSLGSDALARFAEDLASWEAEVSSRRRALHERIDAYQAEIVRRYRSGEAQVDQLLS